MATRLTLGSRFSTRSTRLAAGLVNLCIALLVGGLVFGLPAQARDEGAGPAGPGQAPQPATAGGGDAALLGSVTLYECNDYNATWFWCDQAMGYVGEQDVEYVGDWFNDLASSIRFEGDHAGGRYVAFLYTNPSFGGTETMYVGDDPDFGNDPIGHDTVSSVRIREVPQCTGDGVYVYTDADYGGRCRRFNEADSNLHLTGFDNLISSVRLAGSYVGQYKLTLCDNTNFVEPCSELTADDPNLSNDYVGNDTVSSIGIQYNTNCVGDGVYLYGGTGCTGRCWKWTNSDPSLVDEYYNDMASCIQFKGSYGGGQYAATLYENADYSGAATRFTADDADLSNSVIGDDRASSIGIGYNTNCSGDGVYLYSEPGYGGRCWKWTDDDSSFGDQYFQDMASSIRFMGSYGDGKYEATLYELDDYGGPSSAFRADDDNLGDDAIADNRASSIKVTRTRQVYLPVIAFGAP